MANIPENLRYSRDHEWVSVNGDTASIGITDYAQSSLGDVVYIDLPRVGDRFGTHEAFGSVESVKAVSDIYSPVSGEVVEVNEALAEAPEKLNTDPHGDAWLVKVRLSSPEELKELLTPADYQSYIGA